MKLKQNTLDVLVTVHINKFQEVLTLEQVSRSSNTGTKKRMRNQSFHDLQITLLDLILTSNIA